MDKESVAAVGEIVDAKARLIGALKEIVSQLDLTGEFLEGFDWPLQSDQMNTHDRRWWALLRFQRAMDDLALKSALEGASVVLAGKEVSDG